MIGPHKNQTIIGRANPGASIPATEAVLRIDDKEIARLPVTARDRKVTFTAGLTSGSHRLAPVFITEQGGEIGAYYVIVRKM